MLRGQPPTAAAEALTDAGARRGLIVGLAIGVLLGGFVALALLGPLALPGAVFGGLFGGGLGSAAGASIAARGGGGWRGLLVTLIPCLPAIYLASGFLHPPALVSVLLFLGVIGAAAGAWLDHSLEDLRLAAREAAYRSACQS